MSSALRPASVLQRLLVASLLALAAPGVTALGLGPIEVRSRLGEPLVALIPVHGVAAGEAHFVSAFVADPAAFERLGARRGVLTRMLRLETVTDRGRVAIRVSTLQPVREPAVDLVVEVAHRRSRLVHRYRLTLSPPSVGTATPAPATPPADDAGGVYGPVRATDTLWSLARRLRPGPATTIEQMMVALVRANPRAFTDGRFDGLRRGVRLRIPSRREILATPPDVAHRLVASGRLTSP